MKVATCFGSDLAAERVVASACEHEYLAAPLQGCLPHRQPHANRHSGDGVLDSVGFEPIGETAAKEKTKSRRKNEPDLAALARRASGSAGEAAALATEVDGRGHGKKRDKGGGRTQAWRGKEARKFPRARRKSSAGGCAAEYARVKMRERTQGMPSC